MSKLGRNDPCPCGSGKKYKQCCLRNSPTATVTHSVSVVTIIQAAISSHQAGRLIDAAAHYRQAIGLLSNKQDIATAQNSLGVVLKQLGRVEEAAISFKTAVSLKPDLVDAHGNLGNLLRETGNLEDALTHLQCAVSLSPEFVNAHFGLAAIHAEQGRTAEAIPHLERIISIRPRDAEIHNLLGNAFLAQGHFDSAVACYRRAISIRPDFSDAHANLATLFLKQGKGDAAVDFARQAVSLDPGNAIAHNSLGIALQAQLKLEEACNSFRSALNMNPGFLEVYQNLGNVFRDLGRLDDAIDSYRKSLLINPGFADAYRNLLFLDAYHFVSAPKDYLALALGWELAYLSQPEIRKASARVFSNGSLEGRRLRVGYVSGDFRQHAVSYFVEQLFKHHDRSRIELFAYSTNTVRDAVTDRLQQLADNWAPLCGMSDVVARDRIEADRIDVLIDLSGHSADGRMGIFARRAAPVQAHYLGYFASTGLAEMDYWVGDGVVTPEVDDDHFVEKVWRLPRVWVSYQAIADAPEPDWRAAGDGTIWLGCFHHLAKVNERTLELWARVLKTLHEGRLLLKTAQLADAGNRRRILETMESFGVSAERIELQDGSVTPDMRSHMAYYDRLGIALDPLGSNSGATTTCDALWMSVPVVTLLGDRMGGRSAASLLNAVGHQDLIANTESEYIEKIVALARDSVRLTALRKNLRSRMAQSPLCDAGNLAISLENAYFSMYQKWCERNGVAEK